MIKVINEVEILEINKERTKICRPEIEIKNHPSNKEEVIFCIDNNEYSFDKFDLQSAIDNATNVNRY